MATRPRFPIIVNPGDVLLCDFGPDPRQHGVYPLASGPISLPPEMTKERHAVVIATPSPGLAIIAPFSTREPAPLKPFHVHIPAGSYPFFSRDSWLKGDMLQVASRDRFDRLFFNGRHQRAALSAADFKAVRVAALAGLGLSLLAPHL
jgi:uncharacterized protein YifN (PemK superfamily)